jgi:hypothetical protein
MPQTASTTISWRHESPKSKAPPLGLESTTRCLEAILCRTLCSPGLLQVLMEQNHQSYPLLNGLNRRLIGLELYPPLMGPCSDGASELGDVAFKGVPHRRVVDSVVRMINDDSIGDHIVPGDLAW